MRSSTLAVSGGGGSGALVSRLGVGRKRKEESSSPFFLSPLLPRKDKGEKTSSCSRRGGRVRRRKTSSSLELLFSPPPPPPRLPPHRRRHHPSFPVVLCTHTVLACLVVGVMPFLLLLLLLRSERVACLRCPNKEDWDKEQKIQEMSGQEQEKRANFSFHLGRTKKQRISKYEKAGKPYSRFPNSFRAN